MNRLSTSIENEKLILNGNEIKLPFAAVQVLDWNGTAIVRIEPAIGEVFNRNIYAISNSGNVLWQIEESPHGTENDKPYVSMHLLEGDKLIVGNWNGVDYTVNKENGKITVNSFNK